LQVLEDGVITDAYGQAVDFKNTIVIMTSNIGSQQVVRTGGKMGFKDRRDLVMNEVKRTLSPEFINRIDEIIVFDALSEEQLRQIARIMIQRLNRGLEERGIQIDVTDEVCAWLVDTTCQDRSFGARPLRRAIQRHIEDTLSDALIRGRFQDRGVIHVFVEGDRLQFREAMETTST